MIGGALWEKVVQCGARLKYIKYFINLFSCKKSSKNNSNKIEFNSSEINQNKIIYNKFGYPIYMDRNKKK